MVLRYTHEQSARYSGGQTNMNLKDTRALLFTFPFFLILLSCSDFGKDRIVYSFDEGVCKEAHVPEWAYPGDQRDWGPLTFRHFSGDVSSAILVSRGDRLLASLNKYSLDLNAPEKVQPINDRIWGAASETHLISPADRKTVVEPIEPAGDVRDGVRFRGRLFRPTGRYWPSARDFAAIASPGAEWLALHSQDEERGKGGPIYGEDPSSGQVYLDVFSVADGRKRFTVTGTLHNVTAGTFYSSSGWLGKSYLLIPSLSYQSIIVCNVPRAL